MSHRSSRRLLGPLAVITGLLAAVAFFLGSAGTPGVEAGAGPALQRSVSCADIYQDLDNDTPLGSAPDGDDVPAATSMSRLDVPSQTGGDADITSVTYLGPDLVPGDEGANVGLVPRDSIPDLAPATATCATATANANSGAEKNTFHARMSFANQYGERPTATVRYGTYDATNAEDGAAASTCGNDIDDGPDEGISGYTLTAVQFDELDTDCYDFPGSAPDTLVFSGCAFSESTGAWGRTDVFTVVVNSAAKSVNYGKSVLTLNTAVPAATVDTNGDTFGDTATDPNQCKGGLSFPGVIASTAREITTDETGLSKNSGLTADPDTGTAKDSSDGFADDWDGDGCTDWDELDKNFSGDYPVSVTGPVHGLDPFNPNDCDQNWHSNIRIFTTIVYNCINAGGSCSNAFLATGNGQYFNCLADVNDPKGGGTRDLDMRIGCYSDSTVVLVNDAYGEAAGKTGCGGSPPDDAPQAMCGDGRAGGSPPSATCLNTPGNCTGPFIGIDTAEYPVLATGSYDKSGNTITIGGCFEGFGGDTFGPNVYGQGTFDSRVGAGSFTIHIQIADAADCQNGPPFSSGAAICGIAGTACIATLVELQSKKDNSGTTLGAQLHKNSDRDGCSDTQELRSNAAQGGYRDPFNDYDYMNPTGDKLNRVDDILATVQQYFIDDPAGDIDYASPTDRTAIPGANSWNLGPPNGQQRVDDILASVKQYFHDCAT